VTTKTPSTPISKEQSYTVVYKTPCGDALMGVFFRSLLSSICTNLYASSLHISCSLSPPSLPSTLGSKRTPLSLFLYEIKLLAEPSPSPLKGKFLSSDPHHLGISPSLFSRAFPWHFILDRSLRIVQLGNSLLKLLSPTTTIPSRPQPIQITNSNTSPRVTDFFTFVRPDLGSEISFESIFQRLNTPFLFRLSNSNNKCAEVRLFKNRAFYLLLTTLPSTTTYLCRFNHVLKT
jgi:hypothetical protein